MYPVKSVLKLCTQNDELNELEKSLKYEYHVSKMYSKLASSNQETLILLLCSTLPIYQKLSTKFTFPENQQILLFTIYHDRPTTRQKWATAEICSAQLRSEHLYRL